MADTGDAIINADPVLRERERVMVIFLQLVKCEDRNTPGLFTLAVDTLSQAATLKDPKEALRKMSSALIGYPLIWQCFNTMLPLGLSLPEDVQPPPVLLAPKPLPILEPIEMNRDRRRRREPPPPPGTVPVVAPKRKRTEEEGVDRRSRRVTGKFQHNYAAMAAGV